MFIFDSTTLIAIFMEAGRPDLVEMLLELDMHLVVPSNVWQHEIVDPVTRRGIQRYVQEGKMVILHTNTPEEIDEFGDKMPGQKRSYGLGELDVILTYKKISSSETAARCVLDDRPARNLATRLGIKFTGLLGLLDALADRGIMGRGEADEIKRRLRKGGFRMKPASASGDHGRGV